MSKVWIVEEREMSVSLPGCLISAALLWMSRLRYAATVEVDSQLYYCSTARG